eukprot:7057-Amorphochlora_amoeboformis.AAC.1
MDLNFSAFNMSTLRSMRITLLFINLVACKNPSVSRSSLPSLLGSRMSNNPCRPSPSTEAHLNLIANRDQREPTRGLTSLWT